MPRPEFAPAGKKSLHETLTALLIVARETKMLGTEHFANVETFDGALQNEEALLDLVRKLLAEKGVHIVHAESVDAVEGRMRDFADPDRIDNLDYKAEMRTKMNEAIVKTCADTGLMEDAVAKLQEAIEGRFLEAARQSDRLDPEAMAYRQVRP